MIAMRPIKEPEVIASVCKEEYEGEVFGYIVMDKAEYLGYILYQLQNNITVIVDADIENNMLVDGAVRACVAAGEYKGATHFIIKTKASCLIKWKEVFCKSDEPLANEKLFVQCK